MKTEGNYHTFMGGICSVVALILWWESHVAEVMVLLKGLCLKSLLNFGQDLEINTCFIIV